MPPSRLSGEASFIKGRSKGLNELLKPFDDVAETNSFLLYVMAKRQKGLIDNNPKLKEELPLTTQEMNKILDVGELSSSAYRKKYNETLKRKGDTSIYKQGLEDNPWLLEKAEAVAHMDCS